MFYIKYIKESIAYMLINLLGCEHLLKYKSVDHSMVCEKAMRLILDQDYKKALIYTDGAIKKYGKEDIQLNSIKEVVNMLMQKYSPVIQKTLNIFENEYKSIGKGSVVKLDNDNPAISWSRDGVWITAEAIGKSSVEIFARNEKNNRADMAVWNLSDPIPDEISWVLNNVN